MRNATACFFFTGLPIPGCLAHIPKINANFATLTRPFLPFQTGGQFLYKPMNNMTVFFTGLPIPGCLAHIPKINANFATLTRPFLPFQTGGQFLYKPMNNMTEKQLKTEKQ